MTAINLLNNESHKVHTYQNLLYLEIDLNYYVLERKLYKEQDIEEGHHYSHYKIGDKIYSGFYTTDYVPFANKQISLWEV